MTCTCVTVMRERGENVYWLTRANSRRAEKVEGLVGLGSIAMEGTTEEEH